MLVVQAEHHGGVPVMDQAPRDFAAVRQPEPTLGDLPVTVQDRRFAEWLPPRFNPAGS